MTKKPGVPTQEQIKAAADRAEARARGETAAKEFVATARSEGELDAEIRNLAALPIGVYESKRVAEAKRLGMRAAILDKLVEAARPRDQDRKSTRLNSSHSGESRMPSSA